MAIEALTGVEEFVGSMDGVGWYLTTEEGAVGVGEAVRRLVEGGVSECRSVGVSEWGLGREKRAASPFSLLIGPEGGWTEGELGMFRKAGLTGVRLGGTILRVETAAVAAAVIAATVVAAAVKRGEV